MTRGSRFFGYALEWQRMDEADVNAFTKKPFSHNMPWTFTDN